MPLGKSPLVDCVATVFVYSTLPLRAFLDCIFGVHRSHGPVKQPPYFWERPDLIDPPLRPLPQARPCRLTNAPNVHDQLQSSLIARLPTEIPVLIWQHVLGPEDDGEVLHIELADGILRHNRCYQPGSENPGFQHDCWKSAWRKSFRAGGMRGRGEPVGHRRPILPLLFTCKLMCALLFCVKMSDSI